MPSFIDRVVLHVAGGDGGNGCTSVHREKFKPLAGPDGGDGGHGGDVVLTVDPRVTTLLSYHRSPHQRAGNGTPGMGDWRRGTDGKNLVLPVPEGTVVKDSRGQVIADLVGEGASVVVAQGGTGGRGNFSLASSKRKAPGFHLLGEPGQAQDITLELKTIADVALVGYPSAGKSSLIAAMSAARPKIADYPFTTLVPNLGVVELTIALHRTFRSPRDTIVFDTGHQAYVHKLLTGRQDFSHLRERGGLSGYPSRAESVHDVVENSHASTSLSWADGIARANHLQGHDERHVVAVIGDGAMTWEALDNIADSSDRHLVIVVNDNGRSYAPTIGGLAHHLDALRTNPGYERVLSGVKRTLLSQGAPGRAAFDALHGLKRGLKDVLVPSAFFEDLGIKYTGPVDGHDITAVEFALTRAREYAEPVIVHVITEKGRGYTPAEEHVPDRFHAVGQIHPETGLPVVAERFGWTAGFAEEIVSLARGDERIVGVTAAMQAPVGLQPLADEMPTRVIDVGIAEQHALTFSAGLAFAGMHPVVALYATFLNRAFDQVLMDVALHRAGVTIVLDRAGRAVGRLADESSSEAEERA